MNLITFKTKDGSWEAIVKSVKKKAKELKVEPLTEEELLVRWAKMAKAKADKAGIKITGITLHGVVQQPEPIEVCIHLPEEVDKNGQ